MADDLSRVKERLRRETEEQAPWPNAPKVQRTYPERKERYYADWEQAPQVGDDRLSPPPKGSEFAAPSPPRADVATHSGTQRVKLGGQVGGGVVEDTDPQRGLRIRFPDGTSRWSGLAPLPGGSGPRGASSSIKGGGTSSPAGVQPPGGVHRNATAVGSNASTEASPSRPAGSALPADIQLHIDEAQNYQRRFIYSGVPPQDVPEAAMIDFQATHAIDSWPDYDGTGWTLHLREDDYARPRTFLVRETDGEPQEAIGTTGLIAPPTEGE